MTNPAHELKDLKKILKKILTTQTQLHKLIQRHNSQMTELRTQKKSLQSHITKLEDELAESRADNDELMVRWLRGGMVEERERLVGEKEQLVREKEKLVGEKEQLVRGKEKLVGEKEALIAEKERLGLEKQELEISLYQAENEKSEAKKSAQKYETINITLSKELKARGKKFSAQKEEWRKQKQEFIAQKSEWETKKTEFEAQKEEWESYEDKLRMVIVSLNKQGWDLLTTLFAFGNSDDAVWVNEMDERIVEMVGKSGQTLEMISERCGEMKRGLLEEVAWEGEDGEDEQDGSEDEQIDIEDEQIDIEDDQIDIEDDQTGGVNRDVMMADSEEDL